jgi:cytochrome c-type biogenesis protein CcmH
VAAVAAVLLPLLRRPGKQGPGRAEYDITVYKDQLVEIKRDRERGLLVQAEAEAAAIEIQRRMLKAAGPEETATPDSPGGSPDDGAPAPRNRALPALIAAVIVVAAFSLYKTLGSPDMPNRPYAGRNIAGEIAAREGQLERREVLQLTAKLIENLEKKPNDLKGWILLGRTYLTINEFEGALKALRRATELSGRKPNVAAEYAEAMVIAEEGRIGASAKKLFAAIAAADPFNPKARYYLGLEKAQAGNVRGALQAWVDLAALSDADAPWLDDVNRQIATAAGELGLDAAQVKPSARALALSLTKGLGEKAQAVSRASLPALAMPPAGTAATTMPSRGPPASPRRGPSSEDVKAAGQMSAEDRGAMILSMVKRLADRLADNPDDLAGWRQLAKAYEVLGDREKAEHAREKAKALQK